MKKYKRLFTFGCSFTDYWWLTWPEILGYELDVPVYNYGRCGAGNTYIFNTFCQADAKFNFNEHDLVVISWTNVAREDRHVNGDWITPGNIYTQDIYGAKYVKKWADTLGYLVRDLAYIHSATEILKTRGVDFYNLQMCELVYQADQQSADFNVADKENKHYQNLKKQYKKTIDTLKPSFMTVLWDNNIGSNKHLLDKKYFNYFSDGHPLPLEHLAYLENILNIDFSKNTNNVVRQKQEKFISIINQAEQEYKKSFHLFELPQIIQNRITEECKLKIELKPNVL